ncbi:EamA family transporter [Zhongshania sp.]|uniref:EamA family transporter n=1 Tax=Zhongshania sp. TaxID=1971902 RepID=UPI003569156B
MLARYQVRRVAPFTLGVPVVGMVAGVVILGESVNRLEWLGAGFIMSALFFIVAARWLGSDTIQRQVASIRFGVLVRGNV